MKKLNRRTLLNHSGIAAASIAGLTVKPAQAEAAANSKNKTHLGVYNNSDRKTEVTIEITNPSRDSVLLTQQYSLRGLNESEKVGKQDARFVGQIQTERGSGEMYPLSASLPDGQSASTTVRIGRDGIQEYQMITVKVERDSSLVAFNALK